MGIPKLWGRKPGGVERGFVYSHVLTTYYNWKNKVLLKDKLDDMDRLIAEHGEAIAEKLITNEKFAETLAGYVTKAMMSSVNVNDENKVPTSAFIHSLAQQITANQTAITALNADPNIWRFSGGIQMPTTANLEDLQYTVIGNYYSAGTADVRNNYTNCPLNVAFVLKVFQFGQPSSKYIIQFFISYTGSEIALREYDGWNQRFGNVYHYKGTNE